MPHDRFTLDRRRFALGTLAAAAGLAAPHVARAQGATPGPAWPTRPVRIVVPSAPAGSADTSMRALAERLSANTSANFFVENRPGLAGTIGIDNVVKSAPDGYNFVYVSVNAAVNETLQPRRPFVLTRDLMPVASVNSMRLVFAVTPGLPVRTLPELVAYAKANPGKVNFASSGPGSMFHLSTEVLRTLAGVDMTHVPFRNYNDARTLVMSGQIQLMADATFTLEPLIRDGRMRAIATSGARRSTLFPDVPTVAETFPGYNFGLWNGILAPNGTPAAVVQRLNAEVNRALREPAFMEQNARMDIDLAPMTPAEFGTFVEREVVRLREAVALAKVTPE